MRKVRVRKGMTRIDLVVTSARYDPENGQVSQARAYERIGQVWSDIRLLDRADLVASLEDGKTVVTGVPTSLPGEFEVRQAVRVASGGALVVDGRSGPRDDLEVPTY